jgi:hypothetical protein
MSALQREARVSGNGGDHEPGPQRSWLVAIGQNAPLYTDLLLHQFTIVYKAHPANQLVKSALLEFAGL